MSAELELVLDRARYILPGEQAKWLTRGMDILRADFEDIGETLPKNLQIIVDFWDTNISYSWLGCHNRTYRTDGSPQHCIFVNPTVNGLFALDILVHELVHAVTPWSVHGDHFLAVAEAIGLDDSGSTALADEDLLNRLKDIQEILGSYPLVLDFVEKL